MSKPGLNPNGPPQFGVKRFESPDAGHSECYECGGDGACYLCKATGRYDGKKCFNCNGSRRCIICQGAGQIKSEPRAMAFSIKIQGIPRDDGQPIWSIDNVNWWPRKELLGDPRFRAAPRESGYADHVALLSTVEARALAERYRERGETLDPGNTHALDQKLALEPPVSCWVVVSVYEWDSGL